MSNDLYMQIPALILRKITIVVVPRRSIIHDKVNIPNAVNRISKCAALQGKMTAKERKEVTSMIVIYTLIYNNLSDETFRGINGRKYQDKVSLHHS